MRTPTIPQPRQPHPSEGPRPTIPQQPKRDS
jgi:hypothetical protein